MANSGGGNGGAAPITKKAGSNAALTILIVDDEPVLNKNLARYARRRGYQVLTAFNGHDAFELCRRHAPDIILLDIGLPGMDGRDVMAKLKREGLVDDSLVIFLTGRGDQLDRLLGLRLGADDYETKPFNTVSLFDKIDRMLLRKHGTRAHALALPASARGVI